MSCLYTLSPGVSKPSSHAWPRSSCLETRTLLRTHSSASKLPAVLEAESECDGRHHVSFRRPKPSSSDEYISRIRWFLAGGDPRGAGLWALPCSRALLRQHAPPAEWNIIYDKLAKCAESGAKIVLSRLAIGDLATQYFADRDIFCAGRVSRAYASFGAATQQGAPCRAHARAAAGVVRPPAQSRALPQVHSRPCRRNPT